MKNQCVVKAGHKQKALTFGDLIAIACDACGHRKARGILRLALKARWVEFLGQHRFIIS